MKKIFLSQPMGSRSEEEILKERAELVGKLEELVEEEIVILDTILDLSENAKPLHYLGESIKILAEADFIIMMDNWARARGCRQV